VPDNLSKIPHVNQLAAHRALVEIVEIVFRRPGMAVAWDRVAKVGLSEPHGYGY
jgi:hypothetical protein